MNNISKEKARDLMCGAIDWITNDNLDASNEEINTYINSQLAAIDEPDGIDLKLLQEQNDEILDSETEESLREWLRGRGYLKSPFYCQSDIEDKSICVQQCDHCKTYYKPIEHPPLPSTAGVMELIQAYDEYIDFLSSNPAESIAYVHGFRHSEENIQKGKQMRERISLLKMNLTDDQSPAAIDKE